MRPLFYSLAVLAAALLGAGDARAQLTVPAKDAAELASMVFIKGCVANYGRPDEFRKRLAPGGDMYLPRLAPDQAAPFLNGRAGEAYAFPNDVTGIVLALFDDAPCTVFVQKVQPERMHERLKGDLGVALGEAYAVQKGERTDKNGLLTRRFDLAPKAGGGAPQVQVVLTTSESTNPNLQAIISIGRK